MYENMGIAFISWYILALGCEPNLYEILPHTEKAITSQVLLVKVTTQPHKVEYFPSRGLPMAS